MTPPAPILRVLGVPALHGPDGEPIPFRTRKHFALLIYLALEPQLHRREKLAALLWPTATISEARHSLATGLSVLRAKLGREALETSRESVRLIPGSLEIDLDRLANGQIHATETQPALAVAPLLQEFVVPDAGPWDEWREGLKAKWHPAIRDALLARIDRSRRQGNSRAMEVLADALLLLDDLSEDGVRAKMESRAFAGDRLSALQIYESWKIRLADELGAQPSDLVAGMAMRLRRRGWERTSGENIPAVRTDQWKDRPFVGRAVEYEAIYTGWEGCERGAPRHGLIIGESGVGKSTLMERLTTAAGLQGALSARVQCHEVEREIPYGTIGTLIGMLLDKPGANAVAPEWLGELSRTVSAVRRRFPNAVPPVEATGEMVRIRLADAFHELVRAIAEEQPLILMMDDIHLSDDASVAVMHLLLRRLTDERVLVLCTLRQTDGPLAPSARGMLDRAEIANMSIIPLPPLTEAESGELLTQLIPGDLPQPPATVRRALLRAASGLPMLLELLVRDWQGHGDRCVALAVQAMTEEPGSEGGAGTMYRHILERLLVGLEPNTRSVLNLAAILGSQLNEFELYSLVDLTFAQAMTGLSQLASLRLLRDGGQGLEFVNEVMRGEIYLAVPSSVRKALHSKVADRLIERQQGGEEMLGLAIAWHCIRSGRAHEGGNWLIFGGREAIARSALAEAEEALESGWRHSSGDTSAQCGMLLGEVLLDQFRFDEAHTLLSSVTTRELGGDASHLELLRRYASLGTQIMGSQADLPSLLELVTLADETQADEMRLRVGVLAASLASVVLTTAISERVYSLVVSLREQALPRHVARFDLLLAQTKYWLRDVNGAESILKDLKSRGERDGPAMHRYNLELGLGTCQSHRGRYAEMLESCQTAARLAARAGAPTKEGMALSNCAIALFRLGRHSEALGIAQSAQRLHQRGQGTPSSMNAHAVAGCAHAMLGDRQNAFTELAILTGPSGPRWLSPALSTIAALWHADGLSILGEREQALQLASATLRNADPSAISSAGLLARWAGSVHEHNPTSVTESLIRSTLDAIERLDLLDQYEVALSALNQLNLDQEERARVSNIAQRAADILPPATLRLMSRLGLPSRYDTGQLP